MNELNIIKVLDFPKRRVDYGRGVYFLIYYKNNPIYIGRSKSLYTRLRVHIRCQKSTFNKYAFIQCHGSHRDLCDMETRYIKKYQPKLNNNQKRNPVKVLPSHIRFQPYITNKGKTNNLKQIMRKRGISTIQLSKELKMSYETIRLWKNNTCQPKNNICKKLAQVLGLESIKEIFI